MDTDGGENESQDGDDTENGISASTNAAVLFEEQEKAFKCIRELSMERPEENDYRANDEALVSLRTIFDKYLELPSLLDHHIVEMVDALTGVACPILASANTVQRTTNCSDTDDGNENHEEENTAKEAAGKSSDHLLFWHSPLPRILSAIYALSKVRGRKRVQKFLPHQVEDIEPVLNCLALLDGLARNQAQTASQNDASDGDAPGEPQLWESTYSMWNWMEILGKIPFDCEVVMDGSRVEELLRLATSHLSETGPTRETAASCLARWLTRPDLEDSAFRSSFRDWSLSVLEEHLGEKRGQRKEQTTDHPVLVSTKSNIFTTMGVLQTLVSMLKMSTSHRDKVLASAKPYWSLIEKISSAKNPSSNVLLRKYLVKWWTRLGMLYLPPRVASWRYQRGRRSLKENLQRQLQPSKQKESMPSTATESGSTKASSDSDPTDSSDYFFLVPDEVELCMGLVLASLTDVSTVVRWSVAKGVGRLTERLPAICAEDVIDAMMEFFNDMEQDNDWHGACLTLAELARRGLLLPHRLKDVIPKIVRAIHYDLPRRQTSVGANVRDAACYAYWALARAYSPQILKPFVPQLGQSVVVAFLFDREVNCRRAASAAFQEMVGRQGAQNFRNGISILTAADYFSLGNRKDAYTTIALHVAQYEEYETAIINHLYQVKLSHWDPAIRLLTSQSLNKLTHVNPQYMMDKVVPYLLENCLDEKSLQLRHGATLGLAEITLAFGEIREEQFSLPPQIQKLIAETVPTIEKKRLYRGRGGEQIRAAVCRLIECISLSRIPLTVPQQVRLLDSVDACLPHPNETIQEQAGNALFALTRSYFPVSSKGPSTRLQNRVVDKYAKTARTSINPAATRGFSLALGCLPTKLLAPSSKVLDITLACLYRISNPTAKVGNEKDAETRKNALVSLTRVCETVGLNPGPNEGSCIVGISSKQLNHVFTAYVRAMRDYSTDQRGDVGSKCRLAAMNGLVSLAEVTTTQKFPEQSGSDFFSIEMCTQIIGLLLKQFSEKLNFVRSEAAKCLVALLVKNPTVEPFVAKREMLLDALTPPRFNGSLVYESIDWADASITYPMVMKAAEIDEYFEYVISGLVISTGGLTKAIIENSSQVLIQWTRNADEIKLRRLGNVFLDIFEKHQHEGRVVLPLLKTIEMILNRGCIEHLVREKSFSSLLLERLREESKDCTDIKRLMAIISVSTGLIISVQISKETVSFVCSLLAHEFPRIRSVAAEKLYVQLLETDPELGGDHAAVRLLLEHNWECDQTPPGGIDRTTAINEVTNAFEIESLVL